MLRHRREANIFIGSPFLRKIIGRAGSVLGACLLVLICEPSTLAQNPQNNISLKSGESVVLGLVFYVAHCRSIMIGLPEVEVLEGPPELMLSINEDMVLPRRFNCAAKVSGGTLTAIAKDIKEPIHTRLTYRIKFKTKDGDRQASYVYGVHLFP